MYFNGYDLLTTIDQEVSDRHLLSSCQDWVILDRAKGLPVEPMHGRPGSESHS